MSYLIAEHARHLRAAGRSLNTIHDRVRLLWQLHGTLPHGLAFAATVELEAFLATAAWRQATRATYARHIRRFYAWADAAGHLEGDPAATLVQPRTPGFSPKPCTRAEVAIALGAGEPHHTMFALAYYAGFRAMDVAGCWREHVSRERIRIPDGKGGDAAWVPTHP
jgi:integrase/recombinase XerD